MSNTLHWTNDHRNWYWNVYLKSEHWKNLKAQKLGVSPFCEDCGSRRCLDVHHLNYRNLFDVQLSDLKTLCRNCHEAIHRIQGRPIRSRNSLRISQGQFPESAVQSIRARAQERMERLANRISILRSKRKRIRPELLSRLDDLQRISAGLLTYTGKGI